MRKEKKRRGKDRKGKQRQDKQKFTVFSNHNGSSQGGSPELRPQAIAKHPPHSINLNSGTLGTQCRGQLSAVKTFGSVVHTLFSLLLRARSCFQGAPPVRSSPSQPTLSSFSEGVGLGITHDINPITCQ